MGWLLCACNEGQSFHAGDANAALARHYSVAHLNAKLLCTNSTPGLCLLDAQLLTMDGYPLGSLDHNVPLIVVSGLSSDPPVQSSKTNGRGILLRSDLPPLEGKEVNFLESYFAEVDERGASWTVVTREEPFRLRIKSVGRVRTNHLE